MKPAFTPDDERHMRRALALAARARGRVEPNPMVGAVVVSNGRVAGEGYHRQFGGPHAEVFALAAAGAKARGGTLYVTLEPCCHWGKTPPCTDAVLAAGVARVVVAMIDPFAKVRGRGAALLRRRGVHVDVGLLAADARALNAPFLTRLADGRPYVTAKWAQSLDGCVATAAGESKWISSETSRAAVQTLRGRVDGVVVGIGTALADDPLLTARCAARDRRRLATRIVIDSRCRLPLTSRLVATVPEAPTLVAHAAGLAGAADRRRAALAARGVMTVPVPPAADGRVDLCHFLRHLGGLDYTNLLVEGGPELLAAFFRADLIDEAQVFIAPLIIGGQNARHAVGGPDLAKLAHAHPLTLLETTRRGPDLHLTLKRTPTP